MARFKSVLFLMAMAAYVPLASATVTYQVGGCLANLTNFTTITQALQASTSPNLVKVCPGNYFEQVVITKPVTVEGISADNSDQVIIDPPTTGLVANATNDDGEPVAAQVWVDNVDGEVNLTNLSVFGTGSPPSGLYVGVFYQNSPGTMDRVRVAYQSGNENGFAVFS